MYHYMTLLPRGHCEFLSHRGKTKVGALLARASESLSWTNCTFRSLWLRLMHHLGSLRPRLAAGPWVSSWTFGNGAFLGVLAIEGFFDAGAAFTGTLEAELDDACAGAEAEHGAIEDGDC